MLIHIVFHLTIVWCVVLKIELFTMAAHEYVRMMACSAVAQSPTQGESELLIMLFPIPDLGQNHIRNFSSVANDTPHARFAQSADSCLAYVIRVHNLIEA